MNNHHYAFALALALGWVQHTDEQAEQAQDDDQHFQVLVEQALSARAVRDAARLTELATRRNVYINELNVSKN